MVVFRVIKFSDRLDFGGDSPVPRRLQRLLKRCLGRNSQRFLGVIGRINT